MFYIKRQILVIYICKNIHIHIMHMQYIVCIYKSYWLWMRKKFIMSIIFITIFPFDPISYILNGTLVFFPEFLSPSTHILQAQSSRAVQHKMFDKYGINTKFTMSSLSLFISSWMCWRYGICRQWWICLQGRFIIQLKKFIKIFIKN